MASEALFHPGQDTVGDTAADAAPQDGDLGGFPLSSQIAVMERTPFVWMCDDGGPFHHSSQCSALTHCGDWDNSSVRRVTRGEAEDDGRCLCKWCEAWAQLSASAAVAG